MGPKQNLVHFKSLLGYLPLKSWSSSQHLQAGKKIKGNPIPTFPPCSSFHIGEVIQTWLARLMRRDLGSSCKPTEEPKLNHCVNTKLTYYFDIGI